MRESMMLLFRSRYGRWRSLTSIGQSPQYPLSFSKENNGATMYAIIEDSGTQFKVTTGDTIRIDRKVGEDEKTVTFDRILVVGGEGEPKIGAPLAGVTVTADVIRAV